MNVLVQTLVIMASKLRYNKTYEESEFEMNMLEAFSNNHLTHKSKFHLKKILDDNGDSMEMHHFCDKCYHHIGHQLKNISSAETLHCKNCDHDINSKNNMAVGNIFIYFSLEKQLKEILENEDNLITDIRKTTYTLDDICDGKLYKKNYKDNMVSINFSLDGASVFSSSNNSIYPLTCTLNELGLEQRRSQVMLVSLWYGQGKPNLLNEFLKPFVEECKTLYNHGFTYVRDNQI